MQNDHDDKYEPHEESEYHFTDEDVTYEAEHEPIKPAQPTPSPRESILKQFSQRRLIISGVVFVVLVFAVYQMVAPNSTPTVSTDITAAAPPPPMPQTPAQVAAPQPQVAQPAAPTQPVQPALVPTQAQTQTPEATQTVPQPAATTTTTQTQVTQPLLPAAQPVQVPTTTPTTQVTTTTYVEPQPTTTPPQPTMPAVLPVQTTITTPGTGGLPVVSDQAINAKNEQMSAQLTAAVDQKLSEFSTLNQALQTQVQQLNSRVGAMENQLNQLVNVLTQQRQGSSTTTTTTNVTQSPQVQAAPVAERITIPFNVQAIIPGRAWLKSSTGETLTVAEGDYVTGAGRVTKIDPYDGIVEINVGSRLVSLSYGSTG